jgi:hypothetical protein
MAYNYETGPEDAMSVIWNTHLNFQDMDHDAGKLAQKNKPNKLYETCRNGLFATDFVPDEPELVYVKPLFIPKKDLFTKPSVVAQNFSIRDTEPAYKLKMEEKYTPAYYFDPASRTFPAEFPPSVAKFHEKTIDLQKYGLAVRMNFKFMDNNMVSNMRGKNMCITIDCALPQFRDNHSVYIHAQGYVLGKNGNKLKSLSPGDPANLILGNAEKNKFFAQNEMNQTPENITRGKRLILYKLLGDLLHAAFSTNDDLVFTNDSYLRDRCKRAKVACVAKELDMFDVLLDPKTKLWNVFIDKLYEKDNKTYYEIEGGVKATAIVKSKAKSAAKPNRKVPVPVSKLVKLDSGREDEVNAYSFVRKDNTTKYKKILVSMYNYYVVGDYAYLGEGGNPENNDSDFARYYTMEPDNNYSLANLIEIIKNRVAKIEEDRVANNKAFLAEIADTETTDPYYIGHVDYTELITRIQSLDVENGMSEEFTEIIDIVVNENLLFEGDLEKYFLNHICKDEAKAKMVYDELSALTAETGIILYDYRILSDFVDFYDSGALNVQVIQPAEKMTSVFKFPDTGAFEALKNKIRTQTKRYDPNQVDPSIFNRFDEHQKAEIIDIIKANNLSYPVDYRTIFPNMVEPSYNPPRTELAVYGGGKSKPKRYTKRRKYKSKASTKKKRRGSKKRAGAKSNK